MHKRLWFGFALLTLAFGACVAEMAGPVSRPNPVDARTVSALCTQYRMWLNTQHTANADADRYCI
jgi:hypothetical protein